MTDGSLWRMIEFEDGSGVALGRLDRHTCGISLRDKTGKMSKPFYLSERALESLVNLRNSPFLGRPERIFTELSRHKSK